MAGDHIYPTATRGLTGPGEGTASDRDTAGVRVPPPFLYLAGLALGFGLEALLPSASLAPALAWAAGGLLLAAGLVLSAAFFRAFRRARTPVDLRKPTAALVTTGPYRLSRNPGYLSLTLIYAGIAILTSALWAFVALVPVFVAVEYRVIRREERYLERRFGDEYAAYRSRTRRWL